MTLDDATLAEAAYRNFINGWREVATPYGGVSHAQGGTLCYAAPPGNPVYETGVFRTHPQVEAETMLDRARAFFSARPGFSVICRVGADDDLVEAAQRSGFTLERTLGAMACR